MTLTAKQPYEEYAISFDFTAALGAETIASATVTAKDQNFADVSTTILNVASQIIAPTIVYPWVRAGVDGMDYLITCQVVGTGGSKYELDAILPVIESAGAGISSGGGCVTPPVIEPITLAELKEHLRLDSETFDGNLTLTQSLAYGSKGIQNNYTVHVGTGVEVIGKTSEVLVHHGTNGATGTVDTKIQESDDNTTWTDWTGGTFTQVTTGNDNTDYKKQYTGVKRYIRTASKVLLAACEFGTSVLVNAATTAEDNLLTALIEASREHVEDITRRMLLTQVWDFTLQEWPSKNYIKLPGGNLQSVTSVKWKDSVGTETTLTATTDYLVETNGEQCGRIVLPYGKSWPSGTLYPSNPITIRFVSGWATAAAIPKKIIAACKMIASDLFENREAQIINQSAQTYQPNKTVDALLASSRLWDDF
jgi:uncharacterized phiE125 gp8 family phage protein